MRRIALAITVTLGLAGAAGPALAGAITDTFTSFYAFGDSLTDDGKFGQLPATPPSFEGRFSNGIVWAEHLAADFKAAGRDAGNLAIGGATAGDRPDPLTPLSTFNGQIDTFLGSILFNQPLPTRLNPLSFADAPPAPGDNPLVSVWLGANDLFASFAPADVIAAANAVVDGIARLAASPLGQFDDFLVANLPDLGKTPAYNLLLQLQGYTAGQIAAISGAATAATNLFNQTLSDSLAQAAADLGINIIDLDVNAIFDDVLANPQDYPFASTDVPCTVSLNEANNPFTCNPAEADLLFFTDAVHPNRVAHGLIADAARVALVPLPATAPMILLAIAGFGTLARRRKAA